MTRYSDKDYSSAYFLLPVCVILLSVLLPLLSYTLLEVNFAIKKKILRWTARREASPGIRYMLYPRGFKGKKGESGRYSGHSPVAGECYPKTAPSEADGSGWRAALLGSPSLLGGVVPARPEDSG